MDIKLHLNVDFFLSHFDHIVLWLLLFIISNSKLKTCLNSLLFQTSVVVSKFRATTHYLAGSILYKCELQRPVNIKLNIPIDFWYCSKSTHYQKKNPKCSLLFHTFIKVYTQFVLLM